MRSSTPPTAFDENGSVERFRVTHPFHPHAGREFAVVAWRQNWAEDRVYFEDDQKKLRSLPSRWTSLVSDDSALLVAAGRAPETPVAIIENGTRADELRVFGTLAELPFLVEEEGIRGPALLIIGEVAGLPAEQGRIASILTEASGHAWFGADARQQTLKESAA